MSNRQLRRAAERKAAKQARKDARNADATTWNNLATESIAPAPDHSALLAPDDEPSRPLLREHLNRIDAQHLSDSERTVQYELAFNMARQRVREALRKDQEKAAAAQAASDTAIAQAATSITAQYRTSSDRFAETERLTADVELNDAELNAYPNREAAASTNSRRDRGGPRTTEGKAKASLNSLKHGLTGSFRIVGNEHQDEFDSVVAAYTEEHQPATPTELSLIEKMAEHQWLSRRAQRLQDFALTEDDLPRLNLYIRYQTTNERAFYKAFSEFKKLKKERLAAENQPDQFVSQQQAELNVEWQKGPAKGRSRSTKCKKACDGDSRDPGPVLPADPEEVRLANARALHKEIDSQIRQSHDIPGDGAFAIPMIEVKELFNRCLQEKAKQMMISKAA